MRRLAAILAAALAAVAVLAGIACALPAQDVVDPNAEYGYIYSGTKSESKAFTTAAAHDDTYFLFGSSELATMPELVNSVPDNVFRNYDCGMQFMYVGEAYDQSLWMAIAAGAYADSMPNNKVGIIVSSQWFFDGGLEPGIFKMRFSYPLYQAFCENPKLSDETKRYVAERLHDEGVDVALIDAGTKRLPQDAIDAAVFSAMGDLRLRNSLREVREWAVPLKTNTAKPDFAALREQAVAQAVPACSNNDFHVYNEYWAEYLEPNFASRANEMAGETLTDTPEYDDLSCFLDVCRESGLDPYVIIMPVNGQWYDYAGLSLEVRAACYDRVRKLCAEANVECLDLSPYEYEPYYLRDIMHMGWLGWLDVEQGFMQFAGVGNTGANTSAEAESEGNAEPSGAADEASGSKGAAETTNEASNSKGATS